MILLCTQACELGSDDVGPAGKRTGKEKTLRGGGPEIEETRAVMIVYVQTREAGGGNMGPRQRRLSVDVVRRPRNGE